MNPHYTLANGAYEPTTYELGYIYADLQDIAQAYIDWQQKLGYRMQYEVVESGGLAAAMSYLEPLRRISDAVVFTECENYCAHNLSTAEYYRCADLKCSESVPYSFSC